MTVRTKTYDVSSDVFSSLSSWLYTMSGYESCELTIWNLTVIRNQTFLIVSCVTERQLAFPCFTLWVVVVAAAVVPAVVAVAQAVQRGLPVGFAAVDYQPFLSVDSSGLVH